MSLPENLQLSTRYELKNKRDVYKYLENLTYELEESYRKIAENVNGFIRNDAEPDSAKWTPSLDGTVTGNFTYTRQYGWSIRTGIFTELFFDISWTNTTASGNLYLKLPYKVLTTNGIPFVGTLQPSNITYGGGYTDLVINAISNTYKGEIWKTATGLATTNLGVPNSGRIIGNLRYIGIKDE